MFWLKININAYIVFFTLVKKCVKISKRYIKGQTTQWPQDTKWVLKIRTSEDRQHNGHKIPNMYSESVHQRRDNAMATIYQMGTQNPYIKGQTTQWPQDTKEVLRIRTSKDRQHNGHKIPNGYSESVHQRTDNTMATRYQMGTQNLYIKGQTTQWPQDTKGVLRIRTSKDRQHKVKRQKDKQRSTKHTYKTKDRVTRSPLKTGGGLRCSSFLSKCSSYDINSLS